MIKKGRRLVKDILFVSKITNVNRKKRIIIFAVLLSQISAITDILIIIFFSILITDDFPSYLQQFDVYFDRYKFIIPVIVVLRFYFQYLQGIILKRLELNISLNLRGYLFKEVFEKRNYSVSDAYFFVNVLSGHIAFFYTNVASLLNGLFQMSAYLAYLIITDSRTLLTFVIGIIILFYPVRTLIKKARESMHEVYNYSVKLNDEIQRIVENMFLIKILKKDNEEISNFYDTVYDLNKSELRNFRLGLINSQLPGFITMFIFSSILVVSNFARTITLDFVGVTLRLFQAFATLTGSFNRMINSSVHIENFYKMEQNKNVINKENFVINDVEEKHEIRFENVTFKYINDETVLFENLSFEFNKNEHIIITGPNGSGKSTLLGLMSGVFYPNSGKVFSNSNKMGYIGPTPLIFTDTLKTNVMYGNDKKIGDDVIIEKLKLFDTFKEEKNYDLERLISNTSLSSGQMQKIAFVRALLSDVKILFLDESTANLDDESRTKIFDVLRNQKITIINSTHEPDQFKNVDSHFKIELQDEKRYLVLSK
mgnify:FL=1|tara:strand:+ start:407 stop:2026 length:1620 start_codon:yes stop_codon:yes gene_type:complete